MSVSRWEATPAREAARAKFNQQSNSMYRRAKRASKLTPQQRYEVARRFNEGEQAKPLAEEFGITASYVYVLGSR